MSIVNKNNVELLGWYGGDRRVCLSAWQSTTDELGLDISGIPENARIDEIFKHLSTQKKKTPFELLEMLASHNHGTPFEKVFVDFQITADIASHIHALKHRISHINSESARYKELIDKIYIPEDWKDIEVVSNDAKLICGFEKSETTWDQLLLERSRENNDLYHIACTELTPILGRKRAKESSRYFLQYNKQLNFDWQMNWRSFVNIQNLRNKPDAQIEIREIANEMLRLVENIEGNPFEGCLKAFNLKSNERNSKN